MAGIATARYFMTKLSVLPTKPVFSNEAVDGQVTDEAVASEAAPTENASPEASTTPPPPQPEPENPVVPEIPPDSYEAVVVQPIGLVLRSGPGVEYQQFGGVDYNEEVLVLQTSEDGGWLNVRVQNGQEGWVKAGNTQTVSN
ncbi:MAG: SH3 domain-containing protein [Cyanobacteria bacterium P01_H01_bin.58]